MSSCLSLVLLHHIKRYVFCLANCKQVCHSLDIYYKCKTKGHYIKSPKKGTSEHSILLKISSSIYVISHAALIPQW